MPSQDWKAIVTDKSGVVVVDDDDGVQEQTTSTSNLNDFSHSSCVSCSSPYRACDPSSICPS